LYPNASPEFAQLRSRTFAANLMEAVEISHDYFM
jgi:hypothetical protein